MVQLAGGVGSDFGVPSTPEGLEDVTERPGIVASWFERATMGPT